MTHTNALEASVRLSWPQAHQTHQADTDRGTWFWGYDSRNRVGRRLILLADDPAGACHIRRTWGCAGRRSSQHGSRRRAGLCCVWLRRPCDRKASRLRSYYQVSYQFPWNPVYILGTLGPSHSFTPFVKQSTIYEHNSTPASGCGQIRPHATSATRMGADNRSQPTFPAPSAVRPGHAMDVRRYRSTSTVHVLCRRR